jgi:hypothetical protein
MTPLLVALLTLGTKDYTGLWDTVFEVQRFDSNLNFEEARASAAELLGELARRGYIEFYSVVGALGAASPTRVEVESYGLVLAPGAHWRPPASAQELWFCYLATDKGVDATHRTPAG